MISLKVCTKPSCPLSYLDERNEWKMIMKCIWKTYIICDEETEDVNSIFVLNSNWNVRDCWFVKFAEFSTPLHGSFKTGKMLKLGWPLKSEGKRNRNRNEGWVSPCLPIFGRIHSVMLPLPLVPLYGLHLPLGQWIIGNLTADAKTIVTP